MNKLKNLLVFYILMCTMVLFGMTSISYATAWGQKKNNGVIISQISYYSTNSYWGENRKTNNDDNRYTKISINPYIEYGLGNDYTIFGNFFFNIVKDHDLDNINQGFPQQEIGIQNKVWTKNNENQALAIYGTLIVPIQEKHFPNLGSDSFGIEGGIKYSKKIKLLQKHGFFDSKLGYRIYDVGIDSDQLRLDMSIALDLRTTWQASLYTENVYGISNSDDAYDWELTKLGATIKYFHTERLSYSLGIFKHILGKNMGQDGGIELDVIFNF